MCPRPGLRGQGYTSGADSIPIMQKFTYRAPRYSVDLPVQLSTENSTTLSGRCREISKDGMRVEMGEPLPPGFTGTASLSYQNIALRLRVTAAHTGPDRDGVKFIFESQSERAAVARLVAVLAARTSPAGPRLVE